MELVDRSDQVSERVRSRFGAGTAVVNVSGVPEIPPQVVLQDGLTEEECFQIALWNNSTFQESLAELGLSSAQLFDSGLIADPQFQVFFPLGPKQLEFTTFQTVDALWLQPIRERAAQLDVDRVTETLVQNGLNVIRDARVAHTDLVAAWERADLAREAAALRSQIADLAGRRLAAGDISELEVTSSQIESLRATALADSMQHEVTLARDLLVNAMGLREFEGNLDAIPKSGALQLDRDAAELIEEAVAMRPDLRAAELRIESAQERAGLSRREFLNLDVIYDANGRGDAGRFESGPGLRMRLPIFNGNDGGIAIADARVQQELRRYLSLRDQIQLEVRTAKTRFDQATENLAAVRSDLLPALQQAVELAGKNYENGGTPYFLVLQTTSQYLDARMQELDLVAAQRRAAAELDRSVGYRVCTVITASAGVEERSDVEAAASPDGGTRRLVVSGAAVKQSFGGTSSGPASETAVAVVSDSSTAGKAVREDRGRKRRRRQTQKTKTDLEQLVQEPEHAQVTIDIRLDPRLVGDGLRTGESVSGSEPVSSKN